MRLAIYLYKLSRRDFNYSVSEMTGVRESTVFVLSNEISQAIADNLRTKFVSNLFPKTQGDCSNTMGEMDSEWPQSNETVLQLQKLLFYHPTCPS